MGMGKHAARFIALAGALAVIGSVGGGMALAKTRLTMYWHQAGSTVDKLNKVVAAFEKENPSIEISVLLGPSPWDQYYDKFLVMAAGNAPFDLCQTTLSFVSFARRGVFADLTPYLKRSSLKLPKTTTDAYTYKAKLYGIPWGVFTNPMVTNDGLLAGAGVPALPTDWADSSFTQDTFVAYSRKLTRDLNGDGRPDTFGAYDLYGADFEAFGAEWIDLSTMRATANSKEMVAGWSWVQDLIQSFHVMPTPQDSVRLNLPWDAIRSNKIGMNPFGNWGFDSMKSTKLKWSVGVTPKGVKRTNEMSVDALSVGASSKHKAEAWKFIEYLYSSPEDLTQLCMSMAAMPTVKSALPTFIDAAAKQYPNVNWGSVVDATNYGQTGSLGRTAVSSSIMEAIRDQEIAKLRSGQATVQQALDRIQDRLTKELAKKQ